MNKKEFLNMTGFVTCLSRSRSIITVEVSAKFELPGTGGKFK